ncbi:prephenate dehydratase [Candidatus Micrarchaeota archaeon]|nr:prephenate dehydratase [Candidatus Micrarchaeota archaeon]
MRLEKLRKEIDGIDAELIKLLNKRMETTLMTKNFKTETQDPKREEEVLEKIQKYSGGILSKEFTNELYSKIISESKELQKKKLKLIGFQGEHGAYSEIAVKNYDPKAVSIPHKSFSDVFEGVASGELDLGIVPVENSLAGLVSSVNDLLTRTDLHVIGEIRVPIHHCLLAYPGTEYRDLKVTISHPQALAQCRGFISRNKLEAREHYDTAGSAMAVARDKPAATAAIASRLCAEIYNLDIIKENIEDCKTNTTRFLVLSKEPSKEKGNKCSIVFSTAHKAGALFNVLKRFSEADINLTRIESRPLIEDPGNYAFLLDFQGSAEDSKVKKALEEVKKHTATYKFLGCYKEAR